MGGGRGEKVKCVNGKKHILVWGNQKSKKVFFFLFHGILMKERNLLKHYMTIFHENWELLKAVNAKYLGAKVIFRPCTSGKSKLSLVKKCSL